MFARLILLLPVCVFAWYAHLKLEQQEVREQYMLDGYTCEERKPATGPSHTRDTYYVCEKGNDKYVIGLNRTEKVE